MGLMVTEIVNTVSLSHISPSLVIVDVQGFGKLCARSVLILLMADNKLKCLQVCFMFKFDMETDSFVNYTIKTNEI